MLERIRGLEAEKLEYIADGLAIPSRITYGLMGAKVELEEARLYGHREHVREIEEARKEAEARDIGERVGAELERVRNAPNEARARRFTRRTRGARGNASATRRGRRHRQ